MSQSLVYDHDVWPNKLRSYHGTILKVIFFNSSCSRFPVGLDSRVYVAVNQTSFGNLGRHIHKPSEIRQSRVNHDAISLPFVKHSACLVPRRLVEQKVIAFHNDHSCGRGNINVIADGILDGMIEARKPYRRFGVGLLRDGTPLQTRHNLDECICIESEGSSAPAKGCLQDKETSLGSALGSGSHPAKCQ